MSELNHNPRTELNDTELVDAREATEKDNRQQLTEELQAQLNDRNVFRRAADKLTGRDKDLQAELHARRHAEAVARDSVAQAQRDYDPALAKTEKAGDQLEPEFGALAREAHDSQKAAVVDLADLMQNNGYITKPNSEKLDDTANGDNRNRSQLQGGSAELEGMRERGGQLMHAVDGRMRQELAGLTRETGREEQDPKTIKTLEGQVRLTALIPVVEKTLVKAMRSAVEQGPTAFTLVGEDIDKIATGTDAEAAALTQDAKWRAMASVQSLTGVAPKPSKEGSDNMSMDPTERSGRFPQYPIEVAEVFEQEERGQQLVRPKNVEVHLGLDLVTSVTIQRADGRDVVVGGDKIMSTITPEARQELVVKDAPRRRDAERSVELATETPSVMTSQEANDSWQRSEKDLPQ